jgi:hypothetical protein
MLVHCVEAGFHHGGTDEAAPDPLQRQRRSCGQEIKSSVMMHMKRNRQLAVDYYLGFYYSTLRYMATAIHS